MKILIAYGSLLGKTKRLAEIIATELQKKGFEILIKDISNTQTEELQYYNLVIFGCSTWDEGMLQIDFKEFNSKLMKTDLSGIRFAIFGLGSHKYKHFCTAPDIIGASVRMGKGESIIENLKFDLDHDEPDDKCDKQMIEWIDKISEKIMK